MPRRGFARLERIGMILAMSSPPLPSRRLLAAVLGLLLTVGLPVAAQDEANIEAVELVLHGMTYVVSEGSANELVVEAEVAVVHPGTDTADLETVHALMGSKAPQGVPGGGLEMRCERGAFDLASRDFVATGNVRGVTADGRRFKTDKLHFDAARSRVFTDSYVVIRDRGGVFEGTGFEYFVREDRFRLQGARVRQEGR